MPNDPYVAGQNLVRNFNSMREFVDFASADTGMKKNRASRREGKAWYGADTWEESLAQVFRWEEGAAKVGAMRANIVASVQRFAVESYRSAQLPGAIAMDDLIKGKPRPVIALRKRTEPLPNAGKVVTIVVNPCASGGVSSDVLITRGAAIMALADAIEKRGGKVEMIIRYTNRPRFTKDFLVYEIMVKRAGAKMNLNSIAFAFANPGMLRRLCFSAMETEHHTVRSHWNVPGGYGGVDDMPAKPGEIYMGGAMAGLAQWSSEELATAWVNDYLRDNGWIK